MPKRKKFTLPPTARIPYLVVFRSGGIIGCDPLNPCDHPTIVYQETPEAAAKEAAEHHLTRYREREHCDKEPYENGCVANKACLNTYTVQVYELGDLRYLKEVENVLEFEDMPEVGRAECPPECACHGEDEDAEDEDES